MRKKHLAAAFLLLLSVAAYAQNGRKCGADILLQQLEAQNPTEAQQYWQAQEQMNKEAEAYSHQILNSAAKTTAQVKVPVVFHVLLTNTQLTQLGGTAGVHTRVSQAIDAINRDFNAMNADSVDIPTVFKPLFGNAQISFGIAHTDPNGNSTSGIEIKTTTVNGYDVQDVDPKFSSQGGFDAWDINRYLNVWVVNLNDNTLGYAVSPTLAAAFGVPQIRGVVLDYGNLGSNPGALQWFSPISANNGRTLTHELGHYFELAHIWGNSSPSSGTCTDDDGIGDTPRQEDANYGCPNGVIPNCTNDAHPGGEMYMNYMDYVNDNCMHMFTVGQITKMQQQVTGTGPSKPLTNNPWIFDFPTAVAGIDNSTEFAVYPNPSTGIVNISFSQQPANLQSIHVANVTGQVVKQLTFDNNASSLQQIDMTGMSKGVYFIQCRFETNTVTRKIVLQ